jgi:hypothetical protein
MFPETGLRQLRPPDFTGTPITSSRHASTVQLTQWRFGINRELPLTTCAFVRTDRYRSTSKTSFGLFTKLTAIALDQSGKQIFDVHGG